MKSLDDSLLTSHFSPPKSAPMCRELKESRLSAQSDSMVFDIEEDAYELKMGTIGTIVQL